jgi:hypothetical protein
VAAIVGGPDDGTFVYLDSSDAAIRAQDGAKRLQLRLDEHLVLEPTHDPKARDMYYICGAAGSGKSHFARNLAIRYRALWPRRHIVIVSRLASDATLDSASRRLDLKRINIASLVTDKLELEELSEAGGGALVIIDDVEGLDKATAEAIQLLADDIGNIGRHHHISLAYCTHRPTDYKRTRNLLLESQVFVVFPHFCSAMQLKYLLVNYASLDPKQVAMIRKLPSRWVAVRRLAPPAILSDCGVQLTSADD